jgi:ADP-ribose pyrophosphatase YjhB (NUDIX family)
MARRWAGTMNEPLRAELLAMLAEDQRLRQQASEADVEAAAAVWPAISETDRRNTARVREIIAAHGWPGRTLVGEDGAHAAWLLVQHADHDPEFQRTCLALLAAAVEAGEATAVDHAYLTDRVAVGEDRPQRYGTQFQREGDRFVPAPIADAAQVDERRAALGLPSLADYAETINNPGRPTHPPARRIDYHDDPSAPPATTVVPSANVVVVNSAGEVLLIRRTDNDNWALPGGAMDLGESLIDAARRETAEETGVQVQITGLVGIYTDPRHVIHYPGNDEVRQEFSVVFTARPIGGAPAPSSGSGEVAWFPPAQIGNLRMDRSTRLRITHYLDGHDRPHLG